MSNQLGKIIPTWATLSTTLSTTKVANMAKILGTKIPNSLKTVKEATSPFEILKKSNDITDKSFIMTQFDKILDSKKEKFSNINDALEDVKSTLATKYMTHVETNWVTVPSKRGIYEITELYKLVNTYGGMICGGYARYCASPHKSPVPADDVDVFFPTQSLYDAFINDEIKYKHDSSNPNGMWSAKESSTGYTFVPSAENRFSQLKQIQFLKPEFSGSDVYSTINRFDLSIIRAGFLDLNTIIVDPDFMKDESNYNLRIKRIQTPLGTLSRLMKYSNCGYKISPEEMIKSFLSWEHVSDEDKYALFEGLNIKDEYLEDNTVTADRFKLLQSWYYKLAKRTVGMDYGILQNTYNPVIKKFSKFIPMLENAIIETKLDI